MNKENRNNWDIIVIGGGAAGLMAAGQAAELGARVLLLEKTDGCGKKILVSGKTRCNLTNSANLNHFIAMYGDNGRFLFNAFHHFFRPELLDFVNSQGLETKVERGGRIFPVSDDAHDVLRVFKKYLDANNVRIQLNTKATDIIVKENAVCGVKAHDTIFNCKAVIL
ncbi:MAG TPA: NAD(P)/FAD-dependent oxidoreductase, partial [Smithella sp.]|nr:NAD(P)/FAD-dependent oxidoreductase [Smithella sp.]